MTQINIEYTAAVGTKFFSDGRARPFPGCSIVSAMTPDMPQYGLLATVQRGLARASYADAFTILPTDSLHMTVFDLLCDQVREAAHWSSKVPLDAPLAEVYRQIADLVAQVPFPDRLRMAFDHFELEKTVGPVLVPADEATGEALANFREAIVGATGVRHPNHDTYFYHVSLAYLLRRLSTPNRDEIHRWIHGVNDKLSRDFSLLDLAPPRLVYFPDMQSFPLRPTKP